jgi:glyoxylase-like metal-dependent hydrolase (beta-lactamase superfamily II)
MSQPAFKLGAVTIQRIVEQEAPFFDAFKFFPILTRELFDENRSWLQPRYVDMTGKLILCVQSYIVRTTHHTILIDSCVGNHKPRAGLYPFWNMLGSDRYERELAAAGIDLGEIDYVLCTHLHVDHVGWNTRLENGRWIPTFPKAKYVFADRELAHWTERQRTEPASCPWITDSVLPIVEANRVELVRSNHELTDLVSLMPTPGHTIDHYSVRVGEAGRAAVITGDMIHSPLQARYPEMGMARDFNSRQAGETRRKLFEEICETSTLLCTAHFPSPSTGLIQRRGAAFDFVSVPS